MGRRFALLFFILVFGLSVEAAWRVREAVGFGPLDIRVLGGKFYGRSYTFETDETQAVPAGTALEVENSFGSVQVGAGRAGEARIHLRKVVYGGTEEKARAFADRLRVETALSGTSLRVATNRGTVEHDRQGVGFETHLTVTVAPDTVVTVRNDHGSVQVAGVAAADLIASYDDVTAERISGPVVVKSSHGNATVVEVAGPVSVNARHGDVEVRDAKGDARLETRHGDVSAERTGALVVDAEHGDLAVRGVKGDFSVTGKHFGVDAAEVTGRATVETSYRGVKLAQVTGEARVKGEHVETEITDVGGAATVETTNGDVTLSRVAGQALVTTSHGAVRGAALSGGVRVNSSGGDVTLDGFAGAVDVQTEHASVDLDPEAPLTAPVAVRATNGSVELKVPDGSRFDLDARSGYGELTLSLAKLNVETMDAQHVRGRLGAGGVPVTITAQHGDVSVLSATAAADAGEGQDEDEADTAGGKPAERRD
jgi:DUF4097 and DUF4098 domain-containing protein YvlB